MTLLFEIPGMWRVQTSSEGQSSFSIRQNIAERHTAGFDQAYRSRACAQLGEILPGCCQYQTRFELELIVPTRRDQDRWEHLVKCYLQLFSERRRPRHSSL